MFAAGLDGYAGWVIALGAALLGAALSPATESLIAKTLPRLGGTPSRPTRITAAVVTGVLCAGLTLKFGLSWSLPAFLFLAILGVQLARIDIFLHLLPNRLVAALMTGGLLLLLMPAIFSQQTDNMLRALVGAAILFAGYLILGLISPGGIGMGDVKLAAPIGLYLGYLGWTHLLYGSLMAFVVNGAVILLVVGRKGRKSASEVAYGPSMLAAAAVTSLLFH